MHQGKRGPIKFPDPVYRPPKPDVQIETPQPDSTLDNFDINGLIAQMGM